MSRLAFFVATSVIASLFLRSAEAQLHHAQGEIVGEVTQTSAILQSRLTAVTQLVDGDVPGAAGVGRFEYSLREDFEGSQMTPWSKAEAPGDFILKSKIAGLKPGTRYYYRLIYGPSPQAAQIGETGSFRTLQNKTGVDEVSFVVVTGMNYVSFHFGKRIGGRRDPKTAYQGADKQLGFPALASILKLKPDFFVGTGDNVYYDSYDAMEATTLSGMRRKWHEQLVQPRFVGLFRHVPTYWEKDDHDHRFDDCDRSGTRPPLSDLGIRTFREQVPIVDPQQRDSKTYRTHRINRHLQIWLVEGRDYRSPNKMPDGPDKTLWGAQQIAWLKQTLLASDASFKLLISPTPLVGPDDLRKTDNHTNINGFRHEGREFFRWVVANRLHEQGFYTICGDRHWQYHAKDPLGVEEFSCGALCDANSRLGRKPGDPKSTDPQAKVQQIYTQAQASGGFLRVVVTENAVARFEFYDEKGKLLYQATKDRHQDLNVLGHEAPEVMQKYYLKRIHEQYDRRRVAVEQALESREALEKRQQELRTNLRRVIGELPKKTPLRAQVTGKIRADGYRIEKVVYQSRPGHYVTANLYLPTTGRAPYPGVLIACGHSRLGKVYEPYQRAALLMVKHGFVAMVYDAIGQGERLSYLTGVSAQHKLDHVNSLLVGRTAVGYQVWDGIRSADYLLSRPEVDRQKPLGMTGNSGGGAQTMYLMALDDRVGPAAPSCHITTLERNFELGKVGDGCQSTPRMGAVGIDHADFFAMRAPRPSIILSAEQDYKDIRFTRRTFQETQRVYDMLGQPECMDMFAFDDKHAFSKPRREAAVGWMKQWLLGQAERVVEPDLKTHSPGQLQVTRSGQVQREYPDALSIAALNLRRARQLADARKAFWQSHSRESALAEVGRFIGARREPGDVTVQRKGEVDRGGYRIEKLVLRREDEVPVPALLFLPQPLKGKQAATLYVDGRGKATEATPGGAIQRRLAQGQIVLSIDVRGFGETKELPQAVSYYTGDFRTAMFSLHIGQTLLGQRVEDTLAALEFLLRHDRVDADAIHLVAVQRAGPVALHAGALHGQIASVTLRDSITSWVEDVVARPFDENSISHVVPLALQKYDLTDLAAHLGNKLTIE